MSKIVIIGAGGFGREVRWLIERINSAKPTWDIIGFVDDGLPVGTNIGGSPVIGDMRYLVEATESLSVVCAVGAPHTRYQIMEVIRENDNLSFPHLVDPSVLYSSSIDLGEGSIICAGTILTVNIEIGPFTVINLDSTIGHDVCLGDFVTIYPSCNVSGNVTVGRCSELGTGAQIIQGVRIGESTIVGAGSVVVRDLPPRCTAVGVPAKPIKFHGDD